MTSDNSLQKLITLARKRNPHADFGFLDHTIYAEPLSPQEKQDFIQLIALARAQQVTDPQLESVYRRLLYLYVLNGSRLDAVSQIDRRLRGLMANQLSFVLISGESGIGKTSLVMALRDRIGQLGSQLLVIRCNEQDSSPYSLWRDLVYEMAMTVDVSRAALPAPIGNGRSVSSTGHLIHALTDWLDRCTATQPLVVLLDDLQWTDQDSLVVLNSITSRDKLPPVLFVGTYRQEEKDLGHPLYDYLPQLQRNRQVERIRLSAWTEGDVERLANSYLGPCSPQLTVYLFNQAEGHPFFTVELLQNLIEQDALAQNDAGQWLPPESPMPVPGILRQTIRQRVERTGQDVVKLLTAAAVVGDTWPLAIVEQLISLAEEPLLAALEAALRAELVVVANSRSETYRFAHGLIREVLYDDQLARRRKQQHGQIALQFESLQPDNVYAIAYHLYEAEEWQQAARYCLSASRQASEQFAGYLALDWCRKALQAAERAGDSLDYTDLLAIYDHLGRAYRALEQNRDAELIYSRMRDVAHSANDLIAEGNALVHLSRVRLSLYQFDLAETTSREALKIGEQTGDATLLTRVRVGLSVLKLVRGQLDQSRHYITEALPLAHAKQDWKTQSDLFRYYAYLAILTGRYGEAEQRAQSSLEQALKTADSLTIGSGYQILSYAQIEAGRYRQAYQTLTTILSVVNTPDSHHHQLPRLLNQMGYLFLELDDAREALKWDKKALAASEHGHTESRFEMRRYSLLNIATDYLLLGKLENALTTVSQFEAIKAGAEWTHFRYFNRYLLLMAQIRLAQDAYGEAIDMAREARDFAQAKEAHKNVAKSHWFEGQALMEQARYHEAVAHLETAVAIADRIRHGSLRWKIRLSLAEAQYKVGSATEATLHEARQLLDETTHSLAGSPLETVFRPSAWIKRIESLEQSPETRAKAHPAGLSQREVEVLQLVAQGATDQQVADALHLSVRTVNTHMTSILTKTGCDNRTAATVFAIQNNLVST